MNFDQAVKAYQANPVKEELEKHYHLICVNYDGFDGDSSVPFPDMITVTEKIEKYIQENPVG